MIGLRFWKGSGDFQVSSSKVFADTPSLLSPKTQHTRAHTHTQGNTEKALEKLRSTLQWRKEFQVDKIVQCTDRDGGGDSEMRKLITKENETGKIYVRGYDKDGRVLMYMRQDRENVSRFNNHRYRLVVKPCCIWALLVRLDSLFSFFPI